MDSLKEELKELVVSHPLYLLLETLSEVLHEQGDRDDELFGKGQGDECHMAGTEIYDLSTQVGD